MTKILQGWLIFKGPVSADRYPRSDRKFAAEYLKATLEELNDPENRAAGLLTLRHIAETYGGIAVTQEAGIAREALYRALSPKGNPTLKTLPGVLNAVGIRLSVEHPLKHAA
jgi:probable addiction module antidote protein